MMRTGKLPPAHANSHDAGDGPGPEHVGVLAQNGLIQFFGCNGFLGKHRRNPVGHALIMKAWLHLPVPVYHNLVYPLKSTAV